MYNALITSDTVKKSNHDLSSDIEEIFFDSLKTFPLNMTVISAQSHLKALGKEN